MIEWNNKISLIKSQDGRYHVWYNGIYLGKMRLHEVETRVQQVRR